MGTNQNPWPAREMRTNQKPTPNPSTEGNQLDVSQPRNSRFSNFSRENTLYKQCNPELRAPPYSCCVGIGGSPSSSLVIKTLAFASDIGSLVVIGRFRDLGITGGTLSAPFWCLCQKLSLSPLYFNKTLLHKSSERSSLISGLGLNSSPPGAKNPGIMIQQQPFNVLCM